MAFSCESTTDDVLDGIDLTGRRFVITGAASGLGEESARALAAHGASVVMLARDPRRTQAAAERVRAAVPGAELSLDTRRPRRPVEIRPSPSRCSSAGEPIDVLINNAGVMACPFGHTADGFEMQFGTNHLGHFELTRLLSRRCIAGDAPRIVNLSSAAHGIADVDLDDPNFERTEYDAWVAYGRSKSANALHALVARTRLARARRAVVLGASGWDHDQPRPAPRRRPDAADARPRQGARRGVRRAGGMQFKSIPQGAATQVWAATSPDLADHNGAYLADCGLGVEGGNIGRNGFDPYITDDDDRRRGSGSSASDLLR